MGRCPPTLPNRHMWLIQKLHMLLDNSLWVKVEGMYLMSHQKPHSFTVCQKAASDSDLAPGTEEWGEEGEGFFCRGEWYRRTSARPERMDFKICTSFQWLWWWLFLKPDIQMFWNPNLFFWKLFLLIASDCGLAVMHFAHAKGCTHFVFTCHTAESWKHILSPGILWLI